MSSQEVRSSFLGHPRAAFVTGTTRDTINRRDSSPHFTCPRRTGASMTEQRRTRFLFPGPAGVRRGGVAGVRRPDGVGAVSAGAISDSKD